MKFLIIEDNIKLRRNIVEYFKSLKYECDDAINGKQGLEKLQNNSYDVIVLDVNMPVMGGAEFLKSLRKSGNLTAVITLTSNSLLDDKIDMYERGADDYLTKPFELKELELRLNALARKNNKAGTHILRSRDIELNTLKHSVLKAGEKIEITAKEFAILEFLLISKGHPKNKTQILEKVWGEKEAQLQFSSTTFEAHISNIRKKLGKNLIITIKGVGYVIEDGKK